MSGIRLIDERKFYSFGSAKGLKPVRLWVGRIDEPSDLTGQLQEPVVSTVVTSLRDGMPFIGHAPFLLSTLLAEPFQQLAPFELDLGNFQAQYIDWRELWDLGEASVWDIGPAEVYRDAITYLMGKGKQ
ncbi:MAG: hypothetical protein ACT4OK_21770 [Gemmobacter sp.]